MPKRSAPAYSTRSKRCWATVADKVKDASDTFRSNAAEALDLIRGLFRKKTEA